MTALARCPSHAGMLLILREKKIIVLPFPMEASGLLLAVSHTSAVNKDEFSMICLFSRSSGILNGSFSGRGYTQQELIGKGVGPGTNVTLEETAPIPSSLLCISLVHYYERASAAREQSLPWNSRQI